MLTHELACLVRLSAANGFVDRCVLVIDMPQAGDGIFQRQAVELHADGDVFLEGFHGGREVIVSGRLRDCQMEHEVGVFPVAVPIGRILQGLKRKPDHPDLRFAVPFGRECRRLGFHRHAELVTVLQVGDVFERPEAKRLPQTLNSNETAGALPRIDKALIAKPFQGVTNNRTGNLELRRQFVFRRQTLIALIGPRFDRVLESFENDLAQALAVRKLLSGAHQANTLFLVMARTTLQSVSESPKPPDLVM